MKAVVVASLAFVAHAGATAMYDYKPGQFLVIDGGTSPDKKFSIVAGESKSGDGALALDSDDYYDKPWKVRQNESYSEITKWISLTRFVVSEESQWQVKERDPSAMLGQYGEAEKLARESDEPSVLYHVWFDAEGECELLPADKTRVLSTHPIKEQKD